MANSLKEKNYTEQTAEILPKRAKYYYNTENSIYARGSNDAGILYNGSELRRSVSPEVVLGEINTANEELSRNISQGNPDILPTGKTLSMLSGKHKVPDSPFDNEVPVNYKVNAKGKLIFSVYAIVVLSLILIIALNAIAINKGAEQRSQLSSEIAQLSQQIDEKFNAANTALSDQSVMGMAAGYGMSKSDAEQLQLGGIAAATEVQYKPVTNWFDRLCDLFT